MKVSARNALKGQVTHIQTGAINAAVTIQLAGGDTLMAIVTTDAIQALGLAPPKPVIALVKAPWVILATGADNLKLSARNQLAGKVTSLKPGAVNTEVGLSLPGGTNIFAVITNDAVADLQLTLGADATAIIKASHIILAVPA